MTTRPATAADILERTPGHCPFGARHRHDWSRAAPICRECGQRAEGA